MVSLSASEMDAFYKHELKMEHKEKMIASVKEQMARIQKQLDEESTDIHSLSLSRLSTEEQGRLEQKLLRNEIFAAYAAKHRMKTQEREETKKRLQEAAKLKKEHREFDEQQREQQKKERDAASRVRKLARQEEDHLKHVKKEADIVARKQDMDARWAADNEAKRLEREKRQKEIVEIRNHRMAERQHRIDRKESFKQNYSLDLQGKDSEYMTMMKKLRELEERMKTMRCKKYRSPRRSPRNLSSPRSIKSPHSKTGPSSTLSTPKTRRPETEKECAVAEDDKQINKTLGIEDDAETF